MLVNRRTFIVKPGHLEEAIELLKAEVTRVWPSMPVRYYREHIAPSDTGAFEAEFESLAAYEKAMAEGWPRVSAEYLEKWNQLAEAGGTNEFWELV